MAKKGTDVKYNQVIVKILECKCPMCKKLHKQRIAHKGSTRPWLYCNKCQPKVASRTSHVRPATNHYLSQSCGHFE